jgi:DNA polymerase III subunit delta
VKYTNLRSFEKHLVDASPSHFADLYLILSKDSFQRKQVCDHLISALTLKDIQSFDASAEPIGTILEELNSLSFFSKKRVLLIQNLDKAPKNFLEKLETHLVKLNPAISLILSSASLSAVTKLYKRIEKMGIIFEQPEEKPWEKEKSAQEWVLSKAAQESKSMSQQTALFLVKQIGTDPAVLFQEIEKLICYVGERTELTVQDISSICSIAHTESIWQLGEAIFKRDAMMALRISKGLMEDGLAFLALLRQLRSQFETSYQICGILAQGGTSGDVTQQYPYMKGTILERNMQQARSYGLHSFKLGLLKIDETELKAKNSGIDMEILNELLIAHLVK